MSLGKNRFWLLPASGLLAILGLSWLELHQLQHLLSSSHDLLPWVSLHTHVFSWGHQSSVLGPTWIHYDTSQFLTSITPVKMLFSNSIILLCLSCYNNVSYTGWLINNRKSFLTVLEAGSLRWGCQHSQVLVRALFCQLLVSSMAGSRAAGGHSGNSRKWANPIRGSCTLMTSSTPNYLPRPPSLDTKYHLNRGWVSIYEFGGTETFSP